MVISMLALLAAIVVLAIHHHSDHTPVPEWMKRLLRLPNTAENTENIKREDKTPGNSEASIEEAILLSLSTIIQELKIINKSKGTDTGGDWQKAAKQMDYIFFWTFFVCIAILNLLFLIIIFWRQ